MTLNAIRIAWASERWILEEYYGKIHWIKVVQHEKFHRYTVVHTGYGII